jgi:hypothetical protein
MQLDDVQHDDFPAAAEASAEQTTDATTGTPDGDTPQGFGERPEAELWQLLS